MKSEGIMYNNKKENKQCGFKKYRLRKIKKKKYVEATRIFR